MSSEEEVIKQVKAGEEDAARPGASASAADENTELTEQDFTETDTRPFFFRYITVIVKFIAVLLIAGMWVCTVFLINNRHDEDKDFSPWYCLAASTVISLVELLWYINKCACCKDEGGCCCTCWRVLMWIDNYKKGLVYIIIAVPTFINVTVIAVVCGVLIVVLGLLYIVKSCAYCRCIGGKKYVRRTRAGKKNKSKPDAENPEHAADTR